KLTASKQTAPKQTDYTTITTTTIQARTTTITRITVQARITKTRTTTMKQEQQYEPAKRTVAQAHTPFGRVSSFRGT
ncbi:hypothetical protein ABTE87_22815, partial [Acinetobacter baumannii]